MGDSLSHLDDLLLRLINESVKNDSIVLFGGIVISETSTES